MSGRARFAGPNEVAVEGPDSEEYLTADCFLLGVGTRPARPESVPFNGQTIFTSDEVLHLDHLPKSMIVVRGGVIGTEYACIMATIGVQVTLIEGCSKVLVFLDQEIADAFQYFMRPRGITLRPGERVQEIKEVEIHNGSIHRLVEAQLESGKTLHAETLLYAVGRQGVCQQLGLEHVGIDFDDRERLNVNQFYQTNAEHVYAAGDVIGFLALASTNIE